MLFVGCAGGGGEGGGGGGAAAFGVPGVVCCPKAKAENSRTHAKSKLFRCINALKPAGLRQAP